MRKSSLDGCPDKVNGIETEEIKVFLNGKQELYAVLADEEYGYVIRHSVDDKGVFIESSEDHILPLEQVYGKVKIILNDEEE